MAILLSVGCIGFWVPDFIVATQCIEIRAISIVFTLLLTLVNAFYFTLLMFQRGITRRLEGLPFVLYLLAISVIPLLHTQWLLQIAVLLFQFILALVMSSSTRKERAVEPAFLASILLGLATFLVPDMQLLLPVFWLMFILQHIMSLRVLLASLMGAGVVLLYTILFEKIGWIPSIDWSNIWLRTVGTNNQQLAIVNYLIVTGGLFFGIANFTHQNIENTSITIFVWCLMLAFLPCAILMFFPPVSFTSLFVLALYGLVALAAYFFLSRESVFAGVTFLVFIALLIGIFFVL